MSHKLQRTYTKYGDSKTRDRVFVQRNVEEHVSGEEELLFGFGTEEL